MKNRILSLLLCVCLVLSLFGCAQTKPQPATEPSAAPTAAPTTPPETSAPTETTAAPELSPMETYQQGLQALLNAADVDIRVTSVVTRTVAGTVLEETCRQEIAYRGLGSDALTAQVLDTDTLCSPAGENPTDIVTQMLFADGICYTDVDGVKYFTNYTSEEFLELYYPMELLDTSLYAAVEKLEDGSIRFADASAVESWAGYDLGAPEACEATVTLADGCIRAITYSADFDQAMVPYTVGVTVEYDLGTEALDLQSQIPADTEGLLYTDHPALPALYRCALVNMLAMPAQSYSTSSNVLIQAGGAQIIESGSYQFCGQGDDYALTDKTERYVYSAEGMSTLTAEETYRDGSLTYSQTIDGVGTADILALEPAQVRSIIRDNELRYVAALEELGNLSMEIVNGYVLITGTGNTALGEFLQSAACALYLGNADLLSKMASGFRVDSSECYLSVDPVTMLPAAYGASFEGAHTIQGGDYLFQVDLAMNLGYDYPDIYNSIFDELPPEAEPETKPTPVFYKVTDEQDHVLWLLGTIHVGDVRTEYLPEEIFAAFDAADALAVEFDIDSFYDRVEEDEALLEFIQGAYFYADGTSLPDHLEEDVYDRTIQSLKAAGGYSLFVDSYKPWAVESMLSSALRTVWYGISSHHGVDEMLLSRARDQGKEILDVESGEYQISMFADASDEMQQFILSNTLDSDRIGSAVGTKNLYDQWCLGDEAALIEMLNEEDDLSGMTEEEIALYEQYNEMLLSTRNEGMLEVAEGYLESGKTVFYAVGLAHLLGQDGLVDSLRQAGYTVELICFR